MLATRQPAFAHLVATLDPAIPVPTTTKSYCGIGYTSSRSRPNLQVYCNVKPHAAEQVLCDSRNSRPCLCPLASVSLEVETDPLRTLLRPAPRELRLPARRLVETILRDHSVHR